MNTLLIVLLWYAGVGLAVTLCWWVPVWLSPRRRAKFTSVEMRAAVDEVPDTGPVIRALFANRWAAVASMGVFWPLTLRRMLRGRR